MIYQSPNLFQEQIFFSTLRISRPDTSSMGTGFLVRVPAKDPKKSYIFLVSNKHVIDDPGKKTFLSFHTQNEEGNPVLGDNFNINIERFENGYYVHDTEDIALLNISELYDVAKKFKNKNLYFKTLNTEIFADFNEPGLTAGAKVYFIGYPANRFDTKNNLPILRSGSIASLPRVDYEGRPQGLLDAPVFQGSSGSPVFVSLGGRWKCIGLVCQTMIKADKVLIQEVSDKNLLSQQNLGIGIYIKSNQILELINTAKKDLDSRI